MIFGAFMVFRSSFKALDLGQGCFEGVHSSHTNVSGGSSMVHMGFMTACIKKQCWQHDPTLSGLVCWRQVEGKLACVFSTKMHHQMQTR